MQPQSQRRPRAEGVMERNCGRVRGPEKSSREATDEVEAETPEFWKYQCHRIQYMWSGASLNLGDKLWVLPVAKQKKWNHFKTPWSPKDYGLVPDIEH